MEALKLPKDTDVQKQIRKNAIHQAIIGSIDVPLRLVEVCKIGMEYTYSIAQSSNKSVISDLGIGTILFEAAAQSALLTVEINLASLQDEALKLQYGNQIYWLIDEIAELKMKTLRVTRDRIMQ